MSDGIRDTAQLWWSLTIWTLIGVLSLVPSPFVRFRCRTSTGGSSANSDTASLLGLVTLSLRVHRLAFLSGFSSAFLHASHQPSCKALTFLGGMLACVKTTLTAGLAGQQLHVDIQDLTTVPVRCLAKHSSIFRFSVDMLWSQNSSGLQCTS